MEWRIAAFTPQNFMIAPSGLRPRMDVKPDLAKFSLRNPIYGGQVTILQSLPAALERLIHRFGDRKEIEWQQGSVRSMFGWAVPTKSRLLEQSGFR